MHFVLSILLLVTLGLSTSCSGKRGIQSATALDKSATRKEEPVTTQEKPAPTKRYIEVIITDSWVGEAVRVDITGVGYGFEESENFENPEHWVLSASTHDKLLTRAVNGSVRVERKPIVYQDTWDIHVSFSVTFAAENIEDSEVLIRARPPGGEVYEHKALKPEKSLTAAL